MKNEGICFQAPFTPYGAVLSAPVCALNQYNTKKGMVMFMKLKNPLDAFTKFDIILWIGSVLFITAFFVICGNPDYTVLAASLIGVTSLIFVAKGQVTGQLLMVLFAVVYGGISLKFRYFGEMITYLGMSAPMAAAAAVSWIKNPYKKNGSSEVKVKSLTGQTFIILLLLTAVVTALFYFLLDALNTPNIIFSTVSVATSFLASSLTFLRSHYYALAYAANDIVLIILWILAATEDISYLPMAACFVIFFINDLYGFYSWRKMTMRQSRANSE